MKNEIRESICAGMYIYNTLKNCIIKIQGKVVSLEDKKYLSLYLGLLNTNNLVSQNLENTMLKSNTKFNFVKLNNQEYMQIYNEYFKDILYGVDFNSFDEFFCYLLDKAVVKRLNNEYDLDLNEFIDKSNKRLIKK